MYLTLMVYLFAEFLWMNSCCSMYNACNVCIIVYILKLIYIYIYIIYDMFYFQLLKQEVSVFILDNKAKEFEKMPKRNCDSVFETFKSGPVQLAHLRYPHLLMDESKYEHTYCLQ